MRRAYELWRELESEAGEQLLHVTGIVEAGERIHEGTLLACREHDLPHEVIDGDELGRRFPAYRLPAELPVVFQPDGGFLLPERCIVAHVEAALARGAVVRARERVLEWSETENGVRVTTDRGVVEAERLVLTAGAWSQDVARLPAGMVRGVRQALAWLQPTRPELFAPDRFPVFNLALDGEHFYGFPAFGIPGFKLGRYDHHGEGGDPDGISREPTLEDEAPAPRASPSATSRRAPGRRSRSRRASSSRLRTSTSSSTGIRRAPARSSARASPGTASSSARSSGRSSPTSRSTARRATTSGSSGSPASIG